MKSKNSLILGQGLLIIFVITAFGLIIMNEKGGTIFSPKIEKEINSYLNENYNSIKDSLKQNPIEYNKRKFKLKIESKKNKNLFFYITYNKGNITDTYKEDYDEGNTLLAHIEKKIEKEIFDKTNIECSVKSQDTLNNFTTKLQERIINEDNLSELSFYRIEKELIISKWNKENILSEIENLIKTLDSKNINPKYYKIIISKEEDVSYSIEINNITKDFLNDKNKLKIIENILNNKDTNNYIDNSKITYKYLN